MKLGKLPPQHDPRVPLLSRHVKLIAPQPVTDWSKAVSEWPMLANDQVGDCTAAAVYHLIQCWRANNGSKWEPSTAETLALYSETSDYPAQDNGAVEMDVLKYWAAQGIPGDGVIDKPAFCQLAPQNLDEIRLAIQWFGGCYLGLYLPLSAQTQAVWDIDPTAPTYQAEPGSWGGHAVCAVAYDPHGFTLVTWGSLQRATPAFMQRYCDEAYAVLSREWLSSAGISPPGLNWDTLTKDMQALN